LPAPLAEMTRHLAERMHGPLLLLGARDQQMKAAVQILRSRVERMIAERRASGQVQSDLLGRLLSAQDEGEKAPMTDIQVRDEVLTLFLAGHETTASSLAWALYLLVRHPAIYQQAQAEADALGHPPRSEDLPKLGLIQRVFKETIRLYPPLPAFNRDTKEEIEVCGYRLPPRTVVFICPYATHHRADLWPDPERFDPDRFTPAAEAERPRYAYLPFSLGPRVCIGNHFAQLEGTLVLATLLQRADFELLTGTIEPVALGTLRPRGGVPMRIRLR
jgi:cytochrome P450